MTVGKRLGLTLVEMLVATAVTLVMVLVVTQSFQVVSGIISANRASLELAGQLRGTAIRLQADLDSHSAPITPWLDSSAGLGYFEYIEGPGSDANPRMHPLGVSPGAAQPLFLQRRSSDPIVNLSHIGDVDDIVMFTAKNAEEPFVGMYWFPDVNGIMRPTTISSETAEVVWWTVLQDRKLGQNRSELWDSGETFKLHRRALLIKPELNDPITGMLPPAVLGRYAISPQGLSVFYNENDISVRPVMDENTGAPIGFAANSLNDLTLRQNRFAHYPIAPISPPQFFDWERNVGIRPVFPFEISLNPANPVSLVNSAQWGPHRGADNQWGRAGQDDDFDGTVDNASEALTPGTDDIVGYQIGHDVVLQNVLAFDVRAFDPAAPINAYPGNDGAWGVAGVDDDNANGSDDINEMGWPGSDDLALAPGDPGWVLNPPTLLGTGAYVDLNYLSSALPAPALSSFSNRPYFLDFNQNGRYDRGSDPGLSLSTYDTWPVDFERNGFSEDLDSDNDEGLDGLDDDNRGGVDDLNERETRPPYGDKLRGIQIRIRVLEPDSQQVRQQTVRVNFVD